MVILLITGMCLECAPAPRYKSGNNSTKSSQKKNKIKKNNRYSSTSASSKAMDTSSSSVSSTFDMSKKIFRGTSSYYGPKFHGKLTANGEIFDMYGVSAAHKELPFNTIVRVTNENNGKSHIIRINDRGPYIDGRILDCSFGAAKKLGFVSEGTAPVKIEVIEWGDGKYMHHD